MLGSAFHVSGGTLRAYTAKGYSNNIKSIIIPWYIIQYTSISQYYP